MVVLSVDRTKKLKFATSIADMIVNGAHGKMMDANCLASRLLEDQGKTGNDRLAEFNSLRLMEELNVLETLRSFPEHVNLLIPSHPVVPAVPKATGVNGPIVQLLVAMAVRSEELVL
jgi:hypothetical protein